MLANKLKFLAFSAAFSAVMTATPAQTADLMQPPQAVISYSDALAFSYTTGLSSQTYCAGPLVGGDCRVIEVVGGVDTPVQATTLVTNRINYALDNIDFSNNGNWQLAWGPVIQWTQGELVGRCITHLPVGDTAVYSAANTVAVYANPDRSIYVIGVAGTNPISETGWCVEDFDVDSFSPWPTSGGGVITNGTATGIGLITSMVQPSTNTSLFQFLQSAVGGANGAIDVVVVGHSLGGALAPTLATALADTQNQSLTINWTIPPVTAEVWELKYVDGHLKWVLVPETIYTPPPFNLTWPKWNPNGVAKVSTIAFAGATPGDQAFANHVAATLPGGTQVVSLWNGYDLVPHAWNALGSPSTWQQYDSTNSGIQNLYLGVPPFTLAKPPDNPICVFTGDITAEERAAGIVEDTKCPARVTQPPVSQSSESNVVCPCKMASNLVLSTQQDAYSGATPIGTPDGRRYAFAPAQLTPLSAITKASCPAAFAIKEVDSDQFLTQAIYQHICSYADQFGPANLLSALGEATATFGFKPLE